MSTATIQQGATEPGLVGRLGRATKVEWLKLWTTRMWWGLLIGAAAWVILTTLVLSLAFTTAGDELDVTDPGLLRYLYGLGFANGQVFVIVLGVIAMAGEYRHKTITATFLATPHRGLVVVAKMLAMFVAGAAYGVVLTAGGVITAATVLAAKGFSAGLGAEGVPRTLALSVLGLGLFGVLGVGLATLIRNQVAAIVVAIGLQIVIQPIITLLAQLNDVTAKIAQYLPGSAADALISGSISGQSNTEVLPWWGGALVLLGYAVAFAAIGWALTTRRDVS